MEYELLYWEEHGITARQFSNLIYRTPNLKGCTDGIMGEEFGVRVALENIKDVSDIRKIPDTDELQGDWEFKYKGLFLTIESKNVVKSKLRITSDGFRGHSLTMKSRSRPIMLSSGTIVESRHLIYGAFDILGVDMFAGLKTHTCIFALNRDLPQSTAKKISDEERRISIKLQTQVTWPLPAVTFWTTDLESLLERLYRERILMDSNFLSETIHERVTENNVGVLTSGSIPH
jgi:hypothetical protein